MEIRGRHGERRSRPPTRLFALLTVMAVFAAACGSSERSQPAAAPAYPGEAAVRPRDPGGPPPRPSAADARATPAQKSPLITLDIGGPGLLDLKVPKASRVVIEDLGIDLPIVSSDLQPPPANYPLCDVAQYLTLYKDPGQAGATYIYAHAREGMFLPLLRESERADGARLIGLPVKVYASDAKLYHYEIYKVERHSTSFHLAEDVPPGEQRLILQTSEGPSGTVPKLVVAARFLRSEAADPSEATPEPRPRDCRPGAAPSATPSATPHESVAVASRVRVPAYGIDLPVVSSDLEVPGNRPDFPLCDVAQYLTRYRQPSETGTTYIYAHAREGMFLPLLRESLRADGAALLGQEAIVHTTDGGVHRYEISHVQRHSTDFSLADIVPAGERRLILQTSEGPSGTVPKLVVVARFLASETGSKAEANPPARPRVCA